MIRIPDNYRDAKYLNSQFEKFTGKMTFTLEQEEAIRNLVTDIASDYNHTISRQAWGPGWD